MVPDPFEPYLRQADELFEDGDVVKAGQIWQAILKKVPTHAAARTGLARVKQHFNIRATQESMDAGSASGMTAAQAMDVARLLDQGASLYDMGRLEEALRVWEQVLPLEADNLMARGYINMARSLLGMPLLEEPVPAVAPPQAPEPAPQPVVAPPPPVLAAPPPPQPIAPPPPAAPIPDEDDDDALIRKGCLLFDMGQPEDALERWEQILARNPGHAQARDYAQQVRRQLGMPLLEAAPVSEAPQVAVAAVPAASHVDDDTFERRDRLVREGVQLFDMGMLPEAIAKWEQVLADDPHHADAQGYIAMARKEASGQPAAPTPPPPPPVPALPPLPTPQTAARRASSSQVRQALSQAEHLMQLQRFDEAADQFNRILQVDPYNQTALQGYQQARAFLQAAPVAPVPAAEVIEVEEPAPLESHPATPPPAVMEPPPPQRKGLEVPAFFKNITVPEWLQSTKVLALLGGGLVVILTLFFLVNGHLKDVKLRKAVQDARVNASTAAKKETDAADFKEAAEALVHDINSAIPHEPLIAYARAKTLLALQPDHAAAPQLLSQAKALLDAQAPPTATLKEVDALIQDGNLDQASAALAALLAQDPDNGELRGRLARLSGAMAQRHAIKERWDDARNALRLAQALCPEDRSWGVKLRLLDTLPSIANPDRSRWLPFLS